MAVRPAPFLCRFDRRDTISSSCDSTSLQSARILCMAALVRPVWQVASESHGRERTARSTGKSSDI